MVAYTFKSSTCEAETGRSLSGGLTNLQSEFQDSHDYTNKPCLNLPPPQIYMLQKY